MTNLQAIDLLKGLEQSLDDYCELNDEGKTAFRMAITALEVFGLSEQLPSAQPDVPDTNVGDMISRQAAIDAIERNAYRHTYIDQIVDIIKELPSIQSEQKRGRWIYGEDEYGIDGYHCDKCGFFVPWDYTHKFINYIEDYNFCPSCGADMRGEQNED